MTAFLRARNFRVIVLALTLVSVAAAPALAKRGRCVPPGNSGAWQYSENVPSASCGGQPTNTIHPGSHSHGSGGGAGGGSGGGGGRAVSAATARSLAAQGPAGQAAANFARATAPSSATRHSSIARHPAGRAGAGGSQAGGGASLSGAASPRVSSSVGGTPSPASSIFGTLTGSSPSGGLGVLLPILLGVAFLAMGGFALLRSRKVTGAAPPKRPSAT